MVCVQKCTSQSYNGKCAHDASAKALTHDLLEQGYEAYKDIACIPTYLFCQTSVNSNSQCDEGRYAGKDVKISGELQSLLYIEARTFQSFKGKITWTADCPNLKAVGDLAFYSASNAASTVTFGGTLAALESIGRNAFSYFSGKITFNADCLNLKEVGTQAFFYASNPASRVVLNSARKLESIGWQAFNEFNGIVQLIGQYAQIKSIGWAAFSVAPNSASKVQIKCRSHEGLEVGAFAFDDFGGNRVEAGEGLASRKCAHDASAKALTHELLEQGYEAYKDIECVPAYLFCQTLNTYSEIYSDCAAGRWYGGKDVEITGELNALLHIEYNAFNSFAGKITWTADCPNLKEVGRGAFNLASNAASTVTFGGSLTSLETIKDYAFNKFKGEIAFNATCPLLKEVGYRAFADASNPASTVVLNNAPLLETIGQEAFYDFKGNVQLVGEFSRLGTIGGHAFRSVTNSASRVHIHCRSDEGLTVSSSDRFDAFDNFGGTHVSDGEKVGCSDYTTSTTSTTTATISFFSTVTATSATTVSDTATNFPKLNVDGSASNAATDDDPSVAPTAAINATAGGDGSTSSKYGVVAGATAAGVVVLAIAIFAAAAVSKQRRVEGAGGEAARRARVAPPPSNLVANAAFLDGIAQDEAGYELPSQRQSDLYAEGKVPRLSVHSGISSSGIAECASPLEYATIDTLRAGTTMLPPPPSVVQEYDGDNYAKPNTQQEVLYVEGRVPGASQSNSGGAADNSSSA
eukprot:gene22710-30303_t